MPVLELNNKLPEDEDDWHNAETGRHTAKRT